MTQKPHSPPRQSISAGRGSTETYPLPLLCVSVIILWFSGVASAESTPGYASVQQAFLREDFEQATALAQNFILENPAAAEVPRVWLWLILSLDRLDRSKEALNELERLKSRLAPNDPLWPEVCFWEGEVARRASQMVRSKLAYQRLIERYPGSSWVSQAQLGLGLIYIQQQAYESAVGYLHEVALRRPGTAIAMDALLFEGLCDLRLDRFQDAVGLFEPLLIQLKEPEVIAQASVYLGESLGGLTRYDDAVRSYQRAINVAPLSRWAALAQFGLGWALYQSDRCDESIDAFEGYLNRVDHPEHQLEALFAQGTCLMRMGREREGVGRFEQILTINPKHPLAFESGLVVADTYRREGRLVDAKELLHRLLKRPLDETSRAQLQLRLGAIALEQGNAPQAITVFELARQSGELPIQQLALNGLGDTQLFLGRLADAKRFYEKTILLSERTSLADYARYQIARLQLLLGNLDEALAMFQQLSLSSDPSLANDARLGLALTYLNQHRDDEARALLGQLRLQRPTSVTAARAAYYQALLLLGEGDDLTAQRLCQETIAKAPRTEEALDARLLLIDLQARRTSVRDAIAWLTQLYASEDLPLTHRGKLAKRLGDFARAEQDYAEAIKWYDEAATLLPSMQGEVSYRIASCYEEAGDLELAMRWYQQSEQPPWRIRGQLALAKLLERNDRLSQAEAIYAELANEPIPEAKMAQERLVALRGTSSKEE